MEILIFIFRNATNSQAQATSAHLNAGVTDEMESWKNDVIIFEAGATKCVKSFLLAVAFYIPIQISRIS